RDRNVTGVQTCALPILNGKAFSGGPVWFQTTVDDYGEVWIDGEIDRAFGGSGRGCVSGFNKPNRVRLQKDTGKVEKKKKIMRDRSEERRVGKECRERW